MIGIVGQLNRSEVDFGVAPLTTTLRRAQAAQFADFPIQITIYSGIYKVAEPETNVLLLYLLPFSRIVWILIVVAIIVMIFGHAIASLYSQIFSNNNPDAIIDEISKTNDSFIRLALDNLVDSFFFTINIFFGQGYTNRDPVRHASQQFMAWDF